MRTHIFKAYRREPSEDTEEKDADRRAKSTVSEKIQEIQDVSTIMHPGSNLKILAAVSQMCHTKLF